MPSAWSLALGHSLHLALVWASSHILKSLHFRCHTTGLEQSSEDALLTSILQTLKSRPDRCIHLTDTRGPKSMCLIGRENLPAASVLSASVQISTSAYMAIAVLGERHSLYLQGDSDLEGVFTHPNSAQLYRGTCCSNA